MADPELSAYVGQRLAAVSDRKLPYEFRVLNNSVPNAWALPGGKICINRGLLTELHNESELAAVLGHEIVHAAARHGAQSMSKGILLQGAVLGTAIATQGKDYASLAQLGAGIGAQLISQKYGRDAERESDHRDIIVLERGAVEMLDDGNLNTPSTIHFLVTYCNPGDRNSVVPPEFGSVTPLTLSLAALTRLASMTP